MFRQAASHHGAGRAAEAEALYRTVLKAEPKHARALHGLGVLCSQQRRYDEAVRLLRKAISADPRSAEALSDLGTAFYGQQRNGDAVTWYKRALALKPDMAAAHYSLANVLAASGRHGEALASYERAVALKPDYAEAHHNLGVALAALGRHQDALAYYERALALNPAITAAHYNVANTLAALKRLGEAVQHYEAAIALNPGYTAAYNNLGTALAALGRYEEAVSRLERALAAQPDHAEAHNNLGSVLHALGRYEAAIAHYRQALALRPGYAEAQFNLGNALAALDRVDEALTGYDAAIAIRPAYPEALYNRGNALKRLDRNGEAAASYEQAIAVRPDYMEAYNNLGNALLDLRRYPDAVVRFEKALELCPESAEAHNNLGSALQALGRHAEAITHYETALKLRPGYADAFTNIGNALMEMGRLDEARHAFETAIDLQPRRAKFYRNLVDSKRFTPGDRHLVAMQGLVRDVASLPVEEQVDLHFALGKALGDAGDHALSFRHLVAANALKRRGIVYDEATVLQFFAGLPLVFTRKLMEVKRAAGDPSPVPVFIVGMPRSGTTLIEQILASHPQVFGAGELGTFSELMVATQGLDAALAHLEPGPADDALRELGVRYLESVRALAPDAARITDKMPVNFRLLGMIHLALPNARIIHARRDPVDTCLSCFARAFTGDQPFSYDLSELGRYYRGYHAVMAHWRSVLPPETFLEVDYERVVDDVEGQARRIVAHCGLDWAESCLEFHRTERLVRTASATQVRQPIYKTSVGRWRAYGAMLRPLFEALGPELTGDRRLEEAPAAPKPRADTGQAFAAAVALHRQDRLAEAAAAYSAVLASEPRHFGALYALGALRSRAGQLDEAARLIAAALDVDKTCAEAHHDLGRILFARGRTAEALVHYEAALAVKPDYADALGSYGAALQVMNRPQEAIEPYKKALAIKPAAHLYNNLGNALVAAKRPEEAVAQYDRALALNPDLAEAYANRGVALQTLRRFAEAAEAHRKALALRPAYFDAHYNLGTVLWAMDRPAEALASFEKAVALDPSCAEAHASLGKLMMELGRVDDAVGAFERAVDAAPMRPAFYRNLVDARRVPPGDPKLAAMEELAQRLDTLPASEQTELHFALGKAYADTGDPERSFRHLLAGNALKRRQIGYDEGATLAAFDHIKAVFTPSLMAASRGRGDPSPVPVFVVGMWRSGTTLIEQMLSASARVHGAGELTYIAEAAETLGGPSAGSRAFPEVVQEMTAEQWRGLGQRYLERLRAMAPSADVVVDKMPANFRFLGLIHLALPNARIIHARRDPLDTCVSCFSRLFTQEQPYIYDLGELGRYYRAYHALMEHWRQVLPDGVLLDVDYEDLVAHTKDQAQRIFAHCRLAWDPSCLAFYKLERPVRSASAAQVRQPIYRSAVGRAQVYGDLLGPLIEALGPGLTRATNRARLP